jgi:thienamycin biosynthesis protein ThnN
VIFTTPPALTALACRLSDAQRESIRGVHYGGMSFTAAEMNGFRELFPDAIHLSGYGNTLFGVVMEVADRPRASLDYFPRGNRVLFELVRGEGHWPPTPCGRGETGRILFHRLDKSCLLTGVLERDEAERIPPSAEAKALGWAEDGLRDPRPPRSKEGHLRIGLY